MTVRFSALVIFIGSFLIFSIQPMLGRTLMPSFGGTAAVWTVCLAAYQVLLLAGYGYAHIIAAKGALAQRRFHLALLCSSVAWTLAFAAMRHALRGRLGNSAVPSLEVLFCVMIFAGLPYVLLSANSSLVQAWLVKAPSPAATPGERPGKPARDIYGLYAVSNLGSLLGLLVYPFILEPFVSLNGQWCGFSACLLVYTILLGVLARLTRPGGGADRAAAVRDEGGMGTQTGVSSGHAREANPLPAALARPWLWFALPALSTFLFNATTTHLSLDVTPVPMLWVLLLSAFLLSYVIGFSTVGEKGLILWAFLAVAASALSAAVGGRHGEAGFIPNLSAGLALVLGCGVCLHAWLYRIRPDAAHLTRFYLGIASGGAFGGVCASLVAPVIFNHVWEYPLALAAVIGAVAWLIAVRDHAELKGLSRFALVVAAAGVVLTGALVKKTQARCLLATRNFYGCLRVTGDEFRNPRLGTAMPFFALQHGGTAHGYQMTGRSFRSLPTAYYGVPGGGIAFEKHSSYANDIPMRVGFIGLGVGTMACYGRTNDVYRFYEINRQVLDIASDTNYFSYLSDCRAKVEYVLGDARKSIEAENASRAPPYDILVVDAFTGDSIPFHLTTLEAFRLYKERLAPGGILALHISNWHIDLLPLCKTMARELGFHPAGLACGPHGVCVESHWVMMTEEPHDFTHENVRHIDWDNIRDISPPRDERGSLLGLIRLARPEDTQRRDRIMPDFPGAWR
ncbi:MAG: fused MFS/spermidine synthase [Candidatus Accumulibacter sp.]|jgi:hypothetical protein|nr:fused MFS/spermidine synthase [Accumulibacter sp.]